MYREGRMHVNILWSLNLQQQTTWLLIHPAKSRFFPLISHHGLSADSGSRKAELLLTAVGTTEKFVCFYFILRRFWGPPWWLSGKVELLMKEMWARSLDWEDPLEKEMATHSSVLAWGSYGQGSKAIEITRLG